MAIALYVDEHVAKAIVEGLVERGCDVFRVQDDGGRGRKDEWVLDRAQTLGRVVFTMDKDFLELASRCQKSGTPFRGIIYAHQMRYSVGQVVNRLSEVCRDESPETMMNWVKYL